MLLVYVRQVRKAVSSFLQYTAVYCLRIVVAGHRISDIKQEWENSEWQREVAQEPSPGAHQDGM